MHEQDSMANPPEVALGREGCQESPALRREVLEGPNIA
jgi:hypothetical protein